MRKTKETIPIFYPYVTSKQRKAVNDVLKTRWIGQGPKVEEFEKKFEDRFNAKYAVSVNSGSAALETACDLANLKEGDKVIVTPLTCTASNLPLIRRGCKLIWADIRKDTLNLDNEDVQQKMKDNPDVKAIMNVHLGGIESDICDPFVIVINDAAQALGIHRPQNDYNCYSFQAIKHVTTGDGGMITVNDEEKYKKAKLLRWFGIDRERKKKNNWQAFKEREMVFDIEIPGHKRQMTDIAASMGIAGLEDYDKILNYRKKIFDIYKLIKVDGFTLVDGEKNVYWLATVLVDKRDDFVKKLHDYKIETNLVQIRNDIFNIFGGKRQDLPNMNWVEDRYISIPLHNKMTIKDALYIKKVIESGW